MSKKITAVLALSTLSLALSQVAFASGYHFGTQSVSAQSTANSSTAEAADPSTIFYNPAGLTYLEGTQVSGSLDLVVPSVRYKNAVAYYPSGSSKTVSGQTSGKITENLIAVPHLYASHKINDRWIAGLGIYVPFASATEYDTTSVLRYNVNKTKLTSIDINPAIAYKLNDKHSIGVGVIAQYTKAELRQFSNWGAFLGKNGALDGMANVSGDDWGIGYNLGWLWDVNDKVRVGASYRSQIRHTLKGDAEWSFADTVSSAAAAAYGPTVRSMGYVAKEGAKVDIVTPASLSVHGMWKASPKWNIFGDVTWTEHSKFNNLNIVFDNYKVVANAVSGGATKSNTTTLKPNWRDTYKFALGASYQVSKPWQVRFGLAYDQSPVRSANDRLSTMPDNDRIWLSAGVKYDLNKNSSLDVAYSYIIIKNSSANVNGWCGSSSASGSSATNCVSSRTYGSADYNSKAQILGVSYTYRF